MRVNSYHNTNYFCKQFHTFYIEGSYIEVLAGNRNRRPNNCFLFHIWCSFRSMDGILSYVDVWMFRVCMCSCSGRRMCNYWNDIGFYPHLTYIHLHKEYKLHYLYIHSNFQSNNWNYWHTRTFLSLGLQYTSPCRVYKVQLDNKHNSHRCMQNNFFTILVLLLSHRNVVCNSIQVRKISN